MTSAEAEAYSRKPTWGQSTQHDFLSVLSIAFRWAERTGLLASNPLKSLHKPPMKSRGDKALVNADSHEKLYTVAPAYFKPFLRLLYLTGARPSEVARSQVLREALGRVRGQKEEYPYTPSLPSPCSRPCTQPANERTKGQAQAGGHSSFVRKGTQPQPCF